SVLDQAQFNETDLVSDTAQTTVTIQSGADANETTSIDFKAITESLLGVSAGEINLAGSSSVAEVVTFDTIVVADQDTTYTLTVDGKAYTTASVDANMNTLKDALLLAEADDGTKLNTIFTMTNTGTTNATGDLVLTYINEGDMAAADFTLTAAGTATNFDDGTMTIAAGSSQASDAITAIDAALATVASERATLGATQAQLESTVRNLANVAENTSAAAGRIMDTDYAAETANLTKAQILQQAATSVLAQANAQPQSVLSLLQ
ncbi:flagellin, partial [Luminiphilus sp.]|nr:flagellin [Luminiphilus sp.]